MIMGTEADPIGELYRIGADDPTAGLEMRLPADFLIRIGGLTPERILFGLERHWVDEAEFVRALAENHWDNAIWGPTARLLPDELDQIKPLLRKVVTAEVGAAESFWKYAAAAYLFGHPPDEATRAQLDEVWCSFGHPEDLFPFAPSFQHPLPGSSRQDRRRWDHHRGVWAAYLRERAERLGLPMIDWIP